MLKRTFAPKTVALLLMLIVCAGGVATVQRMFTHEEADQTVEHVRSESQQFRAGYIDVQASIVDLNVLASHMTMRVAFTPVGRFAGDDETLAVPVTVKFDGISNERIAFSAGERMLPHEVEIELYDGEVENYPFDSHRAMLELVVTGADQTPVPAQLDLLGAHHGYHFVDRALPPSSHGYVGIDMTITRSPLLVGIAVFFMCFIWGLTFVNLMILWSALSGEIAIDRGLFTYMTGFIVALYFFREAMPEIPPFLGVYADYLAFFWAEMIGAGCSIMLALGWFYPSSLRWLRRDAVPVPASSETSTRALA
jgi:hypothetical protein